MFLAWLLRRHRSQGLSQGASLPMRFCWARRASLGIKDPQLKAFGVEDRRVIGVIVPLKLKESKDA